MECRTDAWGIDVLVVGGQKALTIPPGLAFLAVSPAGWKQIESIQRPAYYFDLLAYRRSLERQETPYTPSIPLVAALAESLRRIRGGDRENVAPDRVARPCLPGGDRGAGAQIAGRPAGGGHDRGMPAAGPRCRPFLRRLHDRFGVKLAGGQGPLKGTIVRIAHLGLIDELNVLATLAAMELVLLELGQPVKLGAGVGAASEVIAQVAGIS